MDLRQLRYFMTVAEEGHITRAAERLGIQQPPLSRLIKTIERELDVRLFIRRPRGVELTEAGSSFYREVSQVLAGLENAVETTKSTARAGPDLRWRYADGTVRPSRAASHARVSASVSECERHARGAP